MSAAVSGRVSSIPYNEDGQRSRTPADTDDHPPVPSRQDRGRGCHRWPRVRVRTGRTENVGGSLDRDQRDTPGGVFRELSRIEQGRRDSDAATASRRACLRAPRSPSALSAPQALHPPAKARYAVAASDDGASTVTGSPASADLESHRDLDDGVEGHAGCGDPRANLRAGLARIGCASPRMSAASPSTRNSGVQLLTHVMHLRGASPSAPSPHTPRSAWGSR